MSQHLKENEILKDPTILKCFNPFKDLKQEDLDKIAKHTTMRDYKKDQLICTEDTASNSMFFVHKGKVIITKNKVPFSVIEEGEYFGEMSLLKGSDRTATAKAMESTTLIEIPDLIFHEYIESSILALHDILLTYDARLRKHNLLVIEQYQELKSKYNELKKAHQKLLQTEKLATIGMITSGIAHEINNPIFILTGHGDLLKKRIKKKMVNDKFLKEFMSQYSKACKDIENLASGIKNYVRAESSEFNFIKLNDVIDTSMNLVAHLYEQERINISTKLSKENPKLFANSGKIQQIIMNLISNSKYAMKKSKTKKITITTEVKKDSVILKIKDTGTGIKKKDLKKICDDFYTTKPEGEGTGLGMGIVLTIVKELTGEMKIDSEYGKGTTITLTFPLAEVKRKSA